MIRVILNRIDYILLIANVAIRFLFISFPFWGLEYEDAFIFNDTARQINHNYNYYSNYLTESCIDGSYEQCNQFATFGGHFLTFPLILSNLNLLIDYHPHNIFYLNFICSLVLLIVVFIWNRQHRNQHYFSLTAFLLLMLITPFITIFQTSGLVETFSSLLVVLFVLYFFKLNENDFSISNYSFLVALCALIGSVITKRENLILLLPLFVVPIYNLWYKKKVFSYGYLIFLFCSFLSVSFFVHLIDLFSIETNEGGDIGTSTFSISFLFQNLGENLLSLMNYRYWGLTGVLFILSIIFFAIKKDHTLLGLFCLIMSLFYMILYSTHYRSYYQVHYNISDPFETLRYSVNYFPLVCLFISSVNLKNLISKQRMLTTPILVVGIVVVLMLIINVVKTRIGFSRDEYFSRIEPVEKTLEVVKQNDIIISDIPIVFHCYISDKQTVVDFYSLSKAKFDSLIWNNREGNIYLIRPMENSVDSMRYESEINVRDYCYTEINLNLEHYHLIKLCKYATQD